MQTGHSAGRPKVEKRLYTLAEASKFLGMPLKTVRAMVVNGEIPYVKRPNSKLRNRRIYYIDRYDLDKWVESNKTIN